jgi:type VI secretion system secreted protein Hcp
MAVDMFLKLDDVEGESTDSKHAGEIAVLSWSWGLQQPGASLVGSGAGAGKVKVNDLLVTKHVDKASPRLMLACCSGEHFKEALLTVRKAGQTPVEYLKITMKEVFVSSMSIDGTDEQDRPTETIGFSFGEFQSQYTAQKPDGTADATIEMGWNIVKNTKV